MFESKRIDGGNYLGGGEEKPCLKLRLRFAVQSPLQTAQLQVCLLNPYLQYQDMPSYLIAPCYLIPAPCP